MFATMAWKALSQRTLSSGKDYRNSSKDYKLQTPALYFPNQIPSGLPLPPPFPLFLSKMDDLPRGIITNKGLNKRRCYFSPSSSCLSSLYLSIHLSIQCYLWKVFQASFKTSTSFLSFRPSLLSYCSPCDFPDRWAICNGRWVTIRGKFCYCQRVLLLYNLSLPSLSQCIHKEADLLALHYVFIHILPCALKYSCKLEHFTSLSSVDNLKKSSFHCILLPCSRTIVPSQFWIGWKWTYINSVLSYTWVWSR